MYLQRTNPLLVSISLNFPSDPEFILIQSLLLTFPFLPFERVVRPLTAAVTLLSIGSVYIIVGSTKL